MKSDFFRKLDKDKTCWKHTYQMAASLTTGNSLTVSWSVKRSWQKWFLCQRLFYSWSYWGLVKTTAESCWEVGLMLIRQKKGGQFLWYKVVLLKPLSVPGTPHNYLWDLVPRKEQKIFISHKSSLAAPYRSALKAAEPFRWLSLSLDGLPKAAVTWDTANTAFHIPRGTCPRAQRHLLIEGFGEASPQAGQLHSSHQRFKTLRQFLRRTPGQV